METADAPCLVLTTWPLDPPADAVAERLVAEGLAACVAVGAPMTSWYRWQGRLEQSVERQLAVKTTRGRVAALEARLGALHPYEVPEFLVLAAEASRAYGAWIRASTAVPPA